MKEHRDVSDWHVVRTVTQVKMTYIWPWALMGARLVERPVRYVYLQSAVWAGSHTPRHGKTILPCHPRRPLRKTHIRVSLQGQHYV